MSNLNFRTRFMSTVLDQGTALLGQQDSYEIAQYTLFAANSILDPVMSMSMAPMYEHINEEPFPFETKTVE
jgi:hypothetical protein